jgi:hypothetical protein
MADGTAQKCGRVGSCHIYLSLAGNSAGLFCLFNPATGSLYTTQQNFMLFSVKLVALMLKVVVHLP